MYISALVIFLIVMQCFQVSFMQGTFGTGSSGSNVDESGGGDDDQNRLVGKYLYQTINYQYSALHIHF